MATGYIEILRREFSAEEGSFLIQLRPALEWDTQAFNRLAAAMEECCADHAGSPVLERWLAQGFWYVPPFVKNWTSHAQFPREYPAAYYEQAYERLDALAYWFFMGYPDREDIAIPAAHGG